MERKWNKENTKSIVLVAIMALLVFGVVPVSATLTVEVIYEEPVGWNPFGHSALRIGDKVYDVSKEGEGTGKTNIRERNWDDVLKDERGQQTAEVPLTAEQKQQLKENVESEVDSEFDYNFLTNNCADWVEDKLRNVRIEVPDNTPDFPKDTLHQVLGIGCCEYPGGCRMISAKECTDLGGTFYKGWLCDEKGKCIPEFATIAIPVATIMGLLFLNFRRKQKR